MSVTTSDIHEKIPNVGLLALLPLFTSDDKGPSAKEFFQQIEQTETIAKWEKPFTIAALRSKCCGTAQEFMQDKPAVR